MAKVHKPPSVIAVRIREARVAHGFSQTQMAEMLGVGQTLISFWERGGRSNTPALDEKFERMIELLEIDNTPRQEAPRTEAPVEVSKSLRVALSSPEDEFAYSPRKIMHSVQYLQENLPRLFEKLERSTREIQHLEQSQGISAEQLAVLRDKAGRWDKMQELMGRKLP